jgi:hypothetical protein
MVMIEGKNHGLKTHRKGKRELKGLKRSTEESGRLDKNNYLYYLLCFLFTY